MKLISANFSMNQVRINLLIFKKYTYLINKENGTHFWRKF